MRVIEDKVVEIRLDKDEMEHLRKVIRSIEESESRVAERSVPVAILKRGREKIVISVDKIADRPAISVVHWDGDDWHEVRIG